VISQPKKLDSSSDVLERMQELIDIARSSALVKNHNTFAAAMTEIEKMTWLGRLIIHSEWKRGSADS